MLEQEQLTPFKETLILYTLVGAIVLIGVSWSTMFISTIRRKK